MPIPPIKITETNPKTGTLQNMEKRISGLPFKIATGAGVTSVPNTRIVSLQQDANGVLWAVTGAVAEAGNTIVGYGVLEEALQAGIAGSIAPAVNTFQTNDQVTVLRDVASTYAVDFDASNAPAQGIATCRVDLQGRLTSVAADASHIQLSGMVRTSVPGPQMTGQLKPGAYFYQMKDALTP